VVGPKGVDFDRGLAQLERCVEPRRRQIFIQDQGSEAVLEVASGVGRRFGGSGEGGTEGLGAVLAPAEQSVELGEVDQAQELGLLTARSI
jgi:hypothetical protein